MIDVGYLEVKDKDWSAFDTRGELYILESKEDFETSKGKKFHNWSDYDFSSISFPCLAFNRFDGWNSSFNSFLKYAGIEHLAIAKELLLGQKENINEEIFSICLKQVEDKNKEEQKRELEKKLKDEALKRVDFKEMQESIIYFIYEGYEHVGVYLKEDFDIHDFKDGKTYNPKDRDVDVKAVLPLGKKETTKILVNAIKKAKGD